MFETFVRVLNWSENSFFKMKIEIKVRKTLRDYLKYNNASQLDSKFIYSRHCSTHDLNTFWIIYFEIQKLTQHFNNQF